MIAFFLENPNFFAILLGGGIATFSIIKQRQTARDKNTLDFESALEDKTDYDEHWTIVRKVVADRFDEPIQGWADMDRFDTPEAKAIRHVLNRWERASNGVEKKVYSGKFLYEIYGSHVLSIYQFLMPYIKEVRRLRAKQAYVKFESMAVDWLVMRQSEK